MVSHRNSKLLLILLINYNSSHGLVLSNINISSLLMLEFPIACYDSSNKRYKCNKCGYCVNYTMGKTGLKKFINHFNGCRNLK